MTKCRTTGFNENALEIGCLRSNLAYETRDDGLWQVRLCEGNKGCDRFFDYLYVSPSGKQFELNASCGWVTVDGKDVLCLECVTKQQQP